MYEINAFLWLYKHKIRLKCCKAFQNVHIFIFNNIFKHNSSSKTANQIGIAICPFSNISQFSSRMEIPRSLTLFCHWQKWMWREYNHLVDLLATRHSQWAESIMREMPTETEFPWYFNPFYIVDRSGSGVSTIIWLTCSLHGARSERSPSCARCPRRRGSPDISIIFTLLTGVEVVRVQSPGWPARYAALTAHTVHHARDAREDGVPLIFQSFLCCWQEWKWPEYNHLVDLLATRRSHRAESIMPEMTAVTEFPWYFNSFYVVDRSGSGVSTIIWLTCSLHGAHRARSPSCVRRPRRRGSPDISILFTLLTGVEGVRVQSPGWPVRYAGLTVHVVHHARDARGDGVPLIFQSFLRCW
jgi:hypothetical protein